ncbi:MAG: hypothetical protein PHH06_02315 [Candidatus Gracilibacteria bacterium]|nr:hypothetical protein [Candidatus Gracilibacteria bacterium]
MGQQPELGGKNIDRAMHLIELTQKILDEIEEVKLNVEAILGVLELDQISLGKSLATTLNDGNYSKREEELIASILVENKRSENTDTKDLINAYHDLSSNIYEKIRSLINLLKQDQVKSFPEDVKKIMIEIGGLFSQLIPIGFIIGDRLKKTLTKISFSPIDINKIKKLLGGINQKLAIRTTQILDVQNIIEDLIKNNEIAKLVTLVELVEKGGTFKEFKVEVINIESPYNFEKLALDPDKQEVIKNRVIENEIHTIEGEIDGYTVIEKLKYLGNLIKIWWMIPPWLIKFKSLRDNYIRNLALNRIQKRNK